MMIPNKDGTLKVAATANAGTIALPKGGGLHVTFVNVGANLAFQAVGGSGVVAVAPTSNTVGGATPLVANQPASFTLRPTDTHFSIVSEGNSTVYVTRGHEI